MNTTADEAAVLDSRAQANDQAELTTVEQIALIAKHVGKSPRVRRNVKSCCSFGMQRCRAGGVDSWIQLPVSSVRVPGQH